MSSVEPYQGYALSYGAGVNSTALAILLINAGWRGPIVFADTGCEWPETYDYIRIFGRWLDEKGLELVVLRGLPYQRYRKGKTLIEVCEDYNMVPFRYPRWCTVEYKITPCERWLKAHPDVKGWLIGIAADESRRRPDAMRPLVDMSITRSGCKTIIQAAGLAVPRRSHCWICPMQTVAEWRSLLEQHPSLYAWAEQLEEASGRVINSHGITLKQRRARFEKELMLFGADE